MAGFDWDAANRKHLARHKISPAEAEQVFRRLAVVGADEPVDGEVRLRIYGTTKGGRFLTLAYTQRNLLIRVITGWDMTSEELEFYAKEISSDQED